jgi:membrane-associated phospholipid phosphatase
MEWSLLGTIFLWHGAVVRFLWTRPQPATPANSPDAEESEGAPHRSAQADRLITVARGISIIGHPFTFIVLLLLLPFLWRGQLSALRITGVVTIAALVPLGVFMRQRFASGRWETVDASNRRDRPVAYLAAFAVLVPVLLYFSAVERAPVLVRGCLIIGLMMAVGAGLNRWIKGSGHMAFAAFSAVVLTRLHPGFTIAIALFMPLLGWSRVKLQRHTMVEVIGGGVLGLLAGGVMIWF